MNVPATVFEAAMIFCWGVSWPSAVIKTYRSKTVAGVSILFLWFVFAGYVAGMCSKAAQYIVEGFVNPVLVLYLFNLVFVGTEIVLYYRYRGKS